MSYKIIATPRFRRELKRLVKKFRSLKKEYAGPGGRTGKEEWGINKLFPANAMIQDIKTQRAYAS